MDHQRLRVVDGNTTLMEWSDDSDYARYSVVVDVSKDPWLMEFYLGDPDATEPVARSRIPEMSLMAWDLDQDAVYSRDGGKGE